MDPPIQTPLTLSVRIHKLIEPWFDLERIKVRVLGHRPMKENTNKRQARKWREETEEKILKQAVLASNKPERTLLMPGPEGLVDRRKKFYKQVTFDGMVYQLDTNPVVSDRSRLFGSNSKRDYRHAQSWSSSIPTLVNNLDRPLTQPFRRDPNSGTISGTC
jgi:hypothetical protein